eukprot:UN27086
MLKILGILKVKSKLQNIVSLKRVTVVVDLLYPPPPVLLPVQAIFLLKRILLHQGICSNKSLSQCGGGIQ